MKVIFKIMFTIIFMSSSFSLHANKSIVFQCSWDNKKPIKITVNPTKKTATRNDGGASYNVIKITNNAVWLEVHKPMNQAAMKMQMIQRAAAVDNRSGKWIDIVFSMTGTISPIEGGSCWEM